MNPSLRPRIIGAVVATGAFTALLMITQFVLPGTSGRGTPGAILFSGLVQGLLQALVAAGIVLIYRSSNIINFAQSALGAVGGVFTYNFAVLNGWPFILSFIGGLIVATGLGVAVEMAIIRRFSKAPRLVLTVLTIALISVLTGAASFVSSIPGIFPDVQDRTIEQISGQAPVPIPFSEFGFQVGGFPLSFTFAHVLAVVLSVFALLGMALFLKFSRSGMAIRAVAENIERAPLLGIRVSNLSMIVWGIAGFLSGLGIILSGLVTGSFSVGGDSPYLLLTPLAAAVAARMRSISGAAVTAVGISILREAVGFSFENQLPLMDLGMLLLIVIALLFQRSRARSEALEVSSWKATEEYRGIPKEMMEIPAVRFWKYALIGVGLIVVLAFPWVTNAGQQALAGYIAIVAMVMLSLVVLTGWAGQVSLGQFGLVALGAALGGFLTSKAGVSFWLAIFIVPVITAGFSFLLGVPSLRIRGLFLAVSTFAFAFAIRSNLFNENYFSWLLSPRVERPSLLVLDFGEERSMYYLVLLSLVLVILMVTALRRSRVGRVLIALRENEPNAQSFGVSAVKSKLAAFAISGFICGFAGILLAHHQQAVQAVDFEPVLSLQVFLYAVVGGVGSVAGVLMGAAFFAVRSFMSSEPLLAFWVGDFGLLFILFMSPGGLAAIVFGLRDSILRIVAQRRHLLVPSLFADFDPEAVERKLIPFSEPIPNTGLAAASRGRRYRQVSELYGSGSRGLERDAGSTDEAVALGAATEGLQEQPSQATATQPGVRQ
ncbi:MAG: ABC transporter permease [Actinobacteria bacterium]|nr:ABC transporter permease [Actinomycetota bacterium]